MAASEVTELGAGSWNPAGEGLPLTLFADVLAATARAVMGEAARPLRMEELVMRAAGPSGHDRDAERDLVGELARAVVRRVAPEELGLFEETEADYFRDPGLVLRAGRRDETVGFGLDVALLTPYVLMVGTAVVHFLATVVSDALGDELKPMIGGRIQRLLQRDGARTPDRREPAQQVPAPTRGVTADQARAVRRVALQQARRSGLDDEKASLLADAFVGALVVND